MGLASFFASWRGKVATTQSPSPRRSNNQHLASSASRHHWTGSNEAPRNPVTASSSLPVNAARAAVPASKEERRQSRAATLSASKPQSRPNNRRSIFGGRPDDEENGPAMPARAYSRPSKARDEVEMMPPGTAASNDSQTSATTSKSKRLSFGYTLGKRNKDDSKRKSWFSSHRQTRTAADMPPLPPMPVNMPDANRSPTATPSSDKRRSRAASIKSTTSTIRGAKRRSFWSSSNPDESGAEDIPPVPSLIRDQIGTPDSMTSDPFDNVDCTRDADLAPTETRTSGAQSPRPPSVCTVRTVRSYKPKSAAKGFLTSTSGATESARVRYRKSFNVEDDAAMVCLTEEQRIEWTRLMNEGHTFQDQSVRTTNSRTSDVPVHDKYANDQALAALEFGVR